jgi:hypothetical protein
MRLTRFRIVGLGAGILCVVVGVGFCTPTSQLAEQQKKQQQEIQREQRSKESDMGGHQLPRW